MDRMTMFYGNKENFIQCVIAVDKKKDFEKLGFVDNTKELAEKPGRKKVEKED